MSLKTDILKAKRYFQKNGIKSTMYAMAERVLCPYYKDYAYKEPSKETLDEQRNHTFLKQTTFSIVVPAFETKKEHLSAMIDSLLMQSYPHFELILIDASLTDTVKEVAETYGDDRIVYKRLHKNGGISENTNEGIYLAKGEYIGLLDHDDLLTQDALYEMAYRIDEENKKGITPLVLYSDEDKCDGEGRNFFAPHFKTDYNRELLYSNNYICHFFVLEGELMKKLLLRREYDGAQDFDLALRACYLTDKRRKEGEKVSVCHVDRVLYHWRCHENSTAENPESKMYAYEAGKRASDMARKTQGERLETVCEKHLGFYAPDVKNKGELLERKENLGCIGGAFYSKNKIKGGAMDRKGKVLYYRLPKGFGGYMNRAHLIQNAENVDIRNIIVRKELWQEFEQVTGLIYVTKSETDATFDYKKAMKNAGMKKDTDFKELSIKFCQRIKKQGYEIIYWER